MKKAAALTLALGMAFASAACSTVELKTTIPEKAPETAAPEAPQANAALPLKVRSEWFNPGICKPSVIKYYNDVKTAAKSFRPEKILKPGMDQVNPEMYENSLRDGDVIHMGAFGIDRFADSDTYFNFILQNGIKLGTPEDRAAGEQEFCGSMLGYTSALAAAISFQKPVPAPDFKAIAAEKSDPAAPTRMAFDRYNVAACPEPVLKKFREVTGKVMPDFHAPVPTNPESNEPIPESELSPEVAAAALGGKIRTAMVRTAQAGLVFAATEYADHIAKQKNMDEEQAHVAFCKIVEGYTKSLDYFTEKHLDYSMPNRSPRAPEAPKKEL